MFVAAQRATLRDCAARQKGCPLASCAFIPAWLVACASKPPAKTRGRPRRLQAGRSFAPAHAGQQQAARAARRMEIWNESREEFSSGVGGGTRCRRRSPGRRSSGESQGCRIREDLLALRPRILLHPRHRHVHSYRRPGSSRIFVLCGRQPRPELGLQPGVPGSRHRLRVQSRARLPEHGRAAANRIRPAALLRCREMGARNFDRHRGCDPDSRHRRRLHSMGWLPDRPDPGFRISRCHGTTPRTSVRA